MLGIGVWEFPVNTMGFSGTVHIDITDNGGKYGFALRVPGQQFPPVRIMRVERRGDTLHIRARVPQLPNRDIPVAITFDGDQAVGTVSAPFVGRVVLHGRRTA